MSCSEAERRIYLYTELTFREREETDRHIATCASCRQIMERVNDERAMLRGIRQVPPAMPDEALITRRIMSAVQEMQQRKSSVFNVFFSNPFSNPLRYGMAALSLFLVVAFVSEHNMALQSPLLQASYSIEAGQKTELNSASFYEALKAAKEKNKNTTQSIYECVMHCLQKHDAVCTDCRVKLAKLN